MPTFVHSSIGLLLRFWLPGILLLGGLTGPVALSAADSDTTGTGECQAILEHAVSLMNPRIPTDSALQAADSLLTTAQEKGLVKYVGRALYLKGSTVAGTGEREEGLALMRQANRISVLTEDVHYQQKTHYSLAAIFYIMERFDEATVHAQQSIELSRQTGDKLPLGLSINLIGLIQRKLGNYDLAIDYLKTGLGEVNTRMKYMLLQNMGIIYKDQEQYAEAKICFEQVAQYYDSTGINSALLLALNNLGTVELRLKNYDVALDHLKQAQTLVTGNTPSRIRALLILNLGVAYQNLGGCQQAIPYFVEARELLEALDEKESLALALEDEAECRFKTGRPDLAYPLLKRSKIISDSLLDLGRTEAIATLEQEFRQRERELEIERLERKNSLAVEKQYAAEKALRNQYLILALVGLVLVLLIALGVVLFLNQRNRFLKENEADKQQLLRQQIKPHFLFNALNSVQHFLLHDEKKAGLLYLGKLGSLLRLILTNSQLDLVPVAEELKLIRYYLEMEQIRANRQFQFEVVAPAEEELSQLVVPGMVLQVLVENAIWHGATKAPQGFIRVAFVKGERGYDLVVTDNGPGIVSPSSRAKTGPTSVGLDLVRKRLKRASRNKLKFNLILERLDSQDASDSFPGTRAVLRTFMTSSSPGYA